MTIHDPEEITKWIQRQYSIVHPHPDPDIAAALRKFEPFELLARLVRYRPFWLKDCDERSARKILDDPNWDLLKNLLIKHDLMVEREDVPASGRPAPFYHLRDKSALMDLKNPPPKVVPFLMELLNECRAQEVEDYIN